MSNDTKIELEQPAWNDLKKRFENIPAKIYSNFSQALKKAAFLVEGEAKKYTPVDTGRLRASIYTSVYRHYATVQPKTDYAIYVHRRVPFMTTGLYEAEPRINKLFGEALKLSIQK